ncbi:hypothetical protein COCCU_13845 [Corynebacterium occultum]|uniref:PucR C-terminal helix-turn-helix domain-containing protein n=1 Tax=Corynebacterium occultum TaxID=2675219 RepID=A0A6B8W0A7_9CORY|nr:helix-turn-helix domain-containing protein [Corynebacterium occultum]QGU08659.1 hypothetical protein COCCU_13845 [Corynebacterium occultum]
MSNNRSGAAENLSRIQTLTDDLAQELGRSVEVDTPSFEVVCASAQIGAIDERRISSIIHRSPPPEPVPWILSHGVRTAIRPVRLPANPDFEMLPRVCFPVRRAGKLCAYLWLFDEPRMSDGEISRVEEFIDPLAGLFAHDDGLDERARLLDGLATDILRGAEDAVLRAQRGGYLPDDGRLGIHVIRLGEMLDDAPAGRLQRELSRLHRSRSFLVSVDSGMLTVVERSRSETDTAKVLDEVRRAAIISGVKVEAVGSAGVTEAGRARGILRRARFMSEVAALPGMTSPELSWEGAGAWRMLLGWELNETTVHTLSDDATRLLLAGERSYWSTVLAYLDNARNATLTAGELFIHRATLHYRLERAREIIGAEALEDGWRANSLQVALRLHAALAGAGKREIRL